MPIKLDILLKLVQVDTLPSYKFESIGTWNNIIIVEGERSDSKRLIDWLQTQDEFLLFNLRAVWSWKGGVSFAWKNAIHPHVTEEQIDIPGGDIWTVYQQLFLD